MAMVTKSSVDSFGLNSRFWYILVRLYCDTKINPDFRIVLQPGIGPDYEELAELGLLIRGEYPLQRDGIQYHQYSLSPAAKNLLSIAESAQR